MAQSPTLNRATTFVPDPAPELDPLPHGVQLRPLTVHRDERGVVAELFRNEWGISVAPVQWAMIITGRDTMRGVHVHPRHDDYFVLLDGVICTGLHDLRPGSPTEGRACLLELRGDQPTALIIPHGVAHGFLFHTRSTFVLGASHYYDPADELGCHWQDPALGLAWPTAQARVSARDAALPPLQALVGRVPPWRG